MYKEQVVAKIKNTCLTSTPVPYSKPPLFNHICITFRVNPVVPAANPCNKRKSSVSKSV